MRIALIGCLLLLKIVAVAQYVPNNGQAYQLSSVFNPAFTGIEEFGDLKLSYRYQWSGFGANAPTFMNLSFNTRLKQPLDLKYNTMRMSRPSVVQEKNVPKKKRTIHGLSFHIFQSKFGAIKQLGGALGYAWHIPLSSKLKLAVGASSIIENRKIQLSEITFDKPDPFYQHLLNSPSSQLDLSARAGMLLYAKRFYLGVSYLSVINESIEASDVAFEESFYTASLQTGFAFSTATGITIKPSILAYLQKNNKMTVDYNVKAYFQHNMMAGISYRSVRSGVIMLGIQATNFLMVNYSYEISLGDFRQFSNSTHELLLGLRINNFKKLPYYTW
jgi:type IX secretion system PorP/SprF family membrane protein